ncbi:MAG: Ppx/GppA phosphatase family protein [Phycisphaerae bacterium]
MTPKTQHPKARQVHRHPPRLRRTAAPRRPSPHGLRIAAIDIGTNSLHMVVVEVTQQLGFKVLSSEKDLTKLGHSALVKHVLTRSSMEHTLSVLGRYRRIAQQLECDRILAYATSAVRESVNGGDFVQAAKERLGMDVHVISSSEEARLIYLAVRQGVDFQDQPVLIVDIGGGSAEFIVGTAQKALMLESRKVGASRLTQQFVHSDPISRRDLRALQKHIKKLLRPVLRRAKELGVRRIIGTSGTMENLAAMCAGLHGEEETRRRILSRMLREDFDDIFTELLQMDVDERRGIAGLDPGRAEQILAGAAVVNYVFEQINAPAIDVSDRAMREGMIIDYMQTHWPKVRLSVEVQDPRRRSVIELGRRCNYDEKHHQQVSRLAMELFNQLKRVHHLPDKYRELLEYAALGHDLGWHIGHSGHHKHSYYLLKNGDLEGFAPLEIDIIANVARYHRRSFPKKSHEAYMSLAPAERTVVCKLAALLRLAEALDRGHWGNVRALHSRITATAVSVRILTQADPELELWAARHKADMFENVFGRTVRISPGSHV